MSGFSPRGLYLIITTCPPRENAIQSTVNRYSPHEVSIVTQSVHNCVKISPTWINHVTICACQTNAVVNADSVTLRCLRTPSTFSSANVVIIEQESIPLDLSSRENIRILKRPTGDAASRPLNSVRSQSNQPLCHQIRQATQPRDAMEKW